MTESRRPIRLRTRACKAVTQQHTKLNEITNDRGRSGRGRTRPPRSFNPNKAMNLFTPRGSKFVAQPRDMGLAGHRFDPCRIRDNRMTADRGCTIQKEIKTPICRPCSGRLSRDNGHRKPRSTEGAPARNRGMDDSLQEIGVIGA